MKKTACRKVEMDTWYICDHVESGKPCYYKHPDEMFTTCVFCSDGYCEHYDARPVENNNVKHKYVVIVQQETDDRVIFMYDKDQEDLAREKFEEYRLNGPDVYFCEVKNGPCV